MGSFATLLGGTGISDRSRRADLLTQVSSDASFQSSLLSSLQRALLFYFTLCAIFLPRAVLEAVY